MSEINSINVHVFRATTDDRNDNWVMDIKVNCVTAQHERCNRDYSSPGDAITSARHAVNDLVKKEGK